MTERDLKHAGAETGSMRRRHERERGSGSRLAGEAAAELAELVGGSQVPETDAAPEADEPRRIRKSKSTGGLAELARMWIDVWAAVEIDMGSVGFPTIDSIRDPERSPAKLTERISAMAVNPYTGKAWEVDRYRPLRDPKTGQQVEIDTITPRTSRAEADARLIHASVERCMGDGFARKIRRAACLSVYPREGKWSAGGIDLASVAGRAFKGESATTEGLRRDNVEAAMSVNRRELQEAVWTRMAERDGFGQRETREIVRLMEHAHQQVVRCVIESFRKVAA